MALQVETRRVETHIVVLEFTGAFTLEAADSYTIEAILDRLLREGDKKFIFDLTGVERIDSSGVGIVVYCFSKLNRTGAGLRVAGASAGVQQEFEAMRVTTLLPFYNTVGAACEAFTIPPRPKQ